jgi:hypothetical protein
MNDANLRPIPARPIQPQGPAPAGSARPADTDPAAGLAFRALLERLETQADELEGKTKSVADARELSGALDVARASLTDAFSLSDRLLEAFREAHLRSSSSPAGAPVDGAPSASRNEEGR